MSQARAPKIAITFSSSVRGMAVHALKKSFIESGAEVVYTDFRQIIPKDLNVEQIYHSAVARTRIFTLAKQRAIAFLQEGEIDCLLIPGNDAAVDPRLYGAPLVNEAIDLHRAIAEMALIHVAMQWGMPILGVCGGHQIINAYLGGTLAPMDQTAINQQQVYTYADVSVEPQSLLAGLFDPQSSKQQSQAFDRSVFGAHNQVVTQAGGKGMLSGAKKGQPKQDFLRVVARAKDTGKNIEATEAQVGAPLLTTQFHPEVAIQGLPVGGVHPSLYQHSHDADIEENKRIIAAFTDAAKQYRQKKIVHEQLKQLPKNPLGAHRPSIKMPITNHKTPVQKKTVSILRQMYKFCLRVIGKVVRFVNARIVMGRMKAELKRRKKTGSNQTSQQSSAFSFNLWQTFLNLNTTRRHASTPPSTTPVSSSSSKRHSVSVISVPSTLRRTKTASKPTQKTPHQHKRPSFHLTRT